MPAFFSTKRFRYATPRYFRYILHTVHVAPLILGLASAYLFAAVPQIQEVYLGIVEEGDIFRGFAGLLAIAIFSALLYAWNHTVVTRRINAIYPDHADILFDRGIFDVRDHKTLFVSGLPYIGLLLGLFQVYRHVRQAMKLKIGDLGDLSYLATDVEIAAVVTAAFLVGLYLALNYARRVQLWQRSVLWLCYALTFAFVVVPVISSDATLRVCRTLGPLASTGLVLVEIAVVLRILLSGFRWLARFFMALPSLGLLSAGGMSFARRQILVNLAPLLALVGLTVYVLWNDDVSPSKQQAVPQSQEDTLAKNFHDWLKARNATDATNRKFPVFIIAAQGGGIYAASSTAAFLASIQDHCPAFAKHVFAISAVSGGSVGASLFNAALADAPARDEAGCDFHDLGELSRRLEQIMHDDHISPVLAYLLPDIIRGLAPKYIPWVGDLSRKPVCADKGLVWLTRDQILEKSFLYSFATSGNKNAAACPGKDGKSLLGESLPRTPVKYKDRFLPALILNTTWVETGYRVAFSPFPLGNLGGGTLYSIDELLARFREKRADPPLLEAAMVSARFPVVMPPWVLEFDAEAKRMTFVDGGYADSSGAETALEVYNALKGLNLNNVDLYLITLTDKATELTGEDIEPGARSWRNWFEDFLSPFSAALAVRGLQSRKAVTEAHTQLREQDKKEDKQWESDIIIRLDQKAFPLPLGWKLSKLSSQIIRHTIGNPKIKSCEPSKNATSADFIGESNSCAIGRIVKILDPKWEEPPLPSPR